MENAADALKMAAAVLIFVVALSISINAFGEVRLVSRTILDYNDKEYNYDYIDDNGTTKRIVGIDSIIPTIYKAYKENYKIVFDESIPQLRGEGLFQRENETGNRYGIYTIDLESREAPLGTDRQKEQFLMAILYGRNCIKEDGIKESYTYWSDLQNAFKNNLGIYLNDDGIYDKIKDIKLEESVGIYYQEEAGVEDATGGSGDTEDTASVPDANKTIKRVITYTLPNT